MCEINIFRLSDEQRAQAIEQGEVLEKMQSTKDSEETLACLPTLTLADIPHSLPKYDGVSQISLGMNNKAWPVWIPRSKRSYDCLFLGPLKILPVCFFQQKSSLAFLNSFVMELFDLILKPKIFLLCKWRFDDFFIHFDKGDKKTEGEKSFIFKVYTKVECYFF